MARNLARHIRPMLACLAFFSLSPAEAGQQAPPAYGARTLLLPKEIVSGERATLAVLDVNGRLTPGVTVIFSNGDKLKTDATGRALFVAPLTLGVLFVSIQGRPGKVPTAVVSSAEGSAMSIEIASAPQVASLSDRFELAGRGFCGDADANQVMLGGKPALVLASSPNSLIALPPADLEPGLASVQISCAKRKAQPFSLAFASLQLEADSSPLSAEEHRKLLVRIRGTGKKVSLEAHNLAPEIAELTGGGTVRVSSSGGTENIAKFEVVGRKRGSFAISMRLISPRVPPQR